MGKTGKGMVPLSSQTSEFKRAYLDARADRLNWSRSEVLTKVIDYWMATGAPALSELDSPTPIPEIAEFLANDRNISATQVLEDLRFRSFEPDQPHEMKD